MLGFRRSRGCQKFNVKRKKSEIDTVEIFLDALVHKKENKGGYEAMEKALSEKIIRAVFIVFVFGFAILFFRCFYFQVINHDAYAKAAEKNRYLSSEIEAQRGVMYDRNGKQLVSNSQSFDLNCNIDKLPADEFTKDKVIREAAAILGISYDVIAQGIADSQKAGDNVYSVSRDISQDKVIVLETKQDDLSGFEIVKNNKRDYLNGPDFAHVIGYVSGDSSDGQSGLEKEYNDYLKEIPGIIDREKDAKGNLVKENTVKPAQSGDSLVLNIDYDLQEKIVEYLGSAVSDYGAKGGSAVAVNPQTGEILSMVSFPSFDNNIFSKNLTSKEYSDLTKNPSVSFYNRAISGAYPVGSTIKPFIAADALEQGVITPSQEIYCPAEISLKDGTVKKDWAFHGWTDLNKAIAESVDTYFYIVGGGYNDFVGLGISKIAPYLEKFGFGKITDIDLPQESTGLVPDPDWKEKTTGISWYPGDTYNVSIGQGYFKATPLQLAMATSVIANGGNLMKPQLVKSIVDENKNVVKTFSPEVSSSGFAQVSAIESVKEAMKQTVLSSAGTARSLQYLPVTSGAKTGTAQTGKTEVYHNWISVFAPYDNPQIVLVVMVESVPGNTGLANLVSREVLGYYFGAKTAVDNPQQVINEAGN